MEGFRPKSVLLGSSDSNSGKAVLFENYLKKQPKHMPYTEKVSDKDLSPELLQLLEKIKRSGNLSDNSPAIKPSQLIRPYYGKDYDKELEQARQYFNSKFPVIEGTNRRANNMVNYDLDSTEPFSGLEKPVRVTTEDNTPVPLLGTVRERGQPASSSNYLQWEDGKEAIQIKQSPMSIGYKDEWVGEQSKLSLNQQILSAAEHEAGHAAYRGGVRKVPVTINTRQFYPNEPPDGKNRRKMQDEWDSWGSHMGDRKELTNGLGRLQRETFALAGYRITDQAGLEKILNKIDPKVGAKGLTEYSPDARRTLDLLFRAKTNKLHKQNKSIYKDLIELLPSFVSNQSGASYKA
jgi:hypothetical protein